MLEFETVGDLKRYLQENEHLLDLPKRNGYLNFLKLERVVLREENKEIYLDSYNEIKQGFGEYELLLWLAALVPAGITEDVAFPKLVKFIKETIVRRAKTFFDNDFMSVYDYFKKKKIEGFFDDPVIRIEQTKEEVNVYDRNMTTFQRPLRVEHGSQGLTEKFVVVQQADVTFPSLKDRVIALANSLQDQLEIKESNIKGAGHGLFVKTPVGFTKGEYITQYGGTLHLTNPSDGLPISKQSAYVAHFPDAIVFLNSVKYSIYVDGERFFIISEMGRWANGGKGEMMVNAELTVETDQDRGDLIPGSSLTCKFWLRALTNIDQGDEIIIDYGEKYGRLGSCVVCEEETKLMDPKLKVAVCGVECQKTLY